MNIKKAALHTLALMQTGDYPNMPKVSKNHIEFMLEEIVDGNIGGEKAHRWLGWAQCAVYTFGGVDIEELKRLTTGPNYGRHIKESG